MSIVGVRSPAGRHPEKTAVRYARGERIRNPQRLLGHLKHCKQCNDLVASIQTIVNALRDDGRRALERGEKRPSIEAVFKKAGFDRETARQILLRHLRRGPSSQKERGREPLG